MLRNNVYRVYAMRGENLYCVASFNNKAEAEKYRKEKQTEGRYSHYVAQYEDCKLTVIK